MRKTDNALTRRIAALVLRHGSVRAAARVLGVDHAYLYRLMMGYKCNPSERLLRKLGVRRVVAVTYEVRL